MKKIIVVDVAIIAIVLGAFTIVSNKIEDAIAKQGYFLFFGIVLALIAVDLIILVKRYALQKESQYAGSMLSENNLINKAAADCPAGKITEIVLLNEDNEGIRAWELMGRTSLLIGRTNALGQVDIDLEESAYSALIDEQHAILNYAAEKWFIEDLYSKNGVRIKKREDGLCYKLAKDRPCQLSKGDMILIANTKLLLQ